jgi:hypothetical protein
MTPGSSKRAAAITEALSEFMAGLVGSTVTRRLGDEASRNLESGPYHRALAHDSKSSNDDGGP